MLHQSLVHSMEWKVKPIKLLRSASWGKRDWIVWARSADKPKTVFRTLTTTAHTRMRCEIDTLRFTTTNTFWHKIASGLAEEANDSNDTADMEEADREYPRANQSGWTTYSALDWKRWKEDRNWYNVSHDGTDDDDMQIDQEPKEPTNSEEEGSETITEEVFDEFNAFLQQRAEEDAEQQRRPDGIAAVAADAKASASASAGSIPKGVGNGDHQQQQLEQQRLELQRQTEDANAATAEATTAQAAALERQQQQQQWLQQAAEAALTQHRDQVL